MLLDEQFWRDIRQGLTDAGNRGAVAGMLGAPVDAATGLLNAALMLGGVAGHKTGMLTAGQLPEAIEKPVGGSEWIAEKMQNAGMLSDRRNLPAETLAGLLGPGAFNKAGKAVWQMEQNAAMPSPMNTATGNQMGAIVYHGSPHSFDRFDMSKIGTGEGAQAYGHGLYFAENPKVAQAYKDDLGLKVPAFDGRAVSNAAESFAHDLLSKHDPATAKKVLGQYADGGVFGARGDSMRQEIASVIDRYAGAKIGKVTQGNLYKVDIPDQHINKMLDWDKPLSKQKDVEPLLDALQSSPDLPRGFGAAIRAARQRPHFDGNDLYAELIKVMPNDQVTAVLKRAGFSGIKYLDGGSRASGTGSRNYVVFDDKLPKIVGRE